MKNALKLIVFFLVISISAVGKIYIVSMPYITLTELINESSIKTFIDNASLSLLNAQTRNFGNLSSSYSTFGAGARAFGFNDVVTLYRSLELYGSDQERAGDVYKRRTGQNIDDDILAFLDIEVLKKTNEEQYYQIIPGLLASVIKLMGKSAAYVGNTGTIEEPDNPGALAVMTREGLITEGENREVLIKNPQKPFGVEADKRKILELSLNVQSDLIMIELGDLERIEKVATLLSLESYKRHRRAALKKTGDFLNELYYRLELDDKILILNPLPSKNFRDIGFGLGFLAISEKNQGQASLYSNTTKKLGLLALTDLAPTIEGWLGIENPTDFHSGGSIIQRVDKKVNLDELLDNEEISAILKRYRPVFFRIYISLLIATIGFSFVGITFFSNFKLVKYLHIFLFAEAVIPLLLLISGIVSAKLYLYLFTFAIFSSFILGWVNIKIQNKGISTLWPYLVVVGLLVIIVDLVYQGRLIPRSVFGYDLQSGARFYGIGNEYMGYFAGLVLLGVYYLGFRLDKKLLALLLLGLAAIVIAFPQFGANVGGGITMIIAFFTWMKIGMKKNIAPYLLLIPIFLGAWITLDFFKGGSHLIKTIMEIKSGGFQVVLNVIIRKSSTNLRLWQYSLWSKGLIAFVGGLLYLVYKPVESTKLYLEQVVGLRRFLTLTIVTAFAAVCFNDSGVVAGALVFLVPGCYILSSFLGNVTEVFFSRE